jgi:anti-sigma regulatory factor (Ser/Thr protein kinase)
MTGAAQWSLVTADAREASGARREIRRFLANEADAGSDLDAVETIVGELVANVIRHAAGPIGIYVAWDGATAVAIVADRGPGIPPVRCVPDMDATSGRGLFIVQALARCVDIDSSGANGSRITVGLPVHRPVDDGEQRATGT